MQETIIFLQKLLETASGIPLSQIACTRQDLLDFLQTSTHHILDFIFLHNGSFFHNILQVSAPNNAIHEWVFPGGITYLAHGDKSMDSIFLLGPVLTQPFSREDVLYHAEQYRIPSSTKSQILQFCSELPVVGTHILYRTGDLVFGHLTGKKQPMNIVQPDILSPTESPLIPPAFTTEGDIVQMRQVEMRYEYSAALTDAIKQGNLPLALHMIGRYNPDSQTTVRNANPLRNAQNYCIVLNTQLRHALEESGIHPYWVDKLSNEIGLEIEQLKSTAQVPHFFSQIIRRYCRLVQEHTYPNLKPLTNLAVTYIKEHLADNLTVKDTAKALTVNANYLSTLFHQEMGMTFIDFVNRERTNQAAALLKHTNLQIQQIAATVGYNNTSYFAKQFLKFQGTTPSQYRHADI